MRNADKSRRSALDLTPVLGLVAILIPMLLMAYMPHVLAAIETRPPDICIDCDESDAARPVIPTVHLSEHGLRLEQVVVSPGTPPAELALPCSGACRTAADYDWAGLQDALANTRAETSGSGVVRIVVSDDLVYEVVVNAMDACRERIHADGSRQLLYPDPLLASAG